MINPKLDKLNITVYPTALPTEQTSIQLSFPKSDNPTISIIIAVYNNLSFTYNCLRAVLEHTSPLISYEVIVVNDGSTDETLQVLSKIPNLTILSNSKNIGFVLSCNKGAAVARGKYVCFLNNDTIVQKNWLFTMLELIENDTKIGVVGSKLVFSDGDLQEAGGIVWKDGNTYHYGRRDSINNEKYNYIREVDYCSGASFLLLKSDFNLLQGFDEIYTPGYYEDTDLCFSMKYILNKKVIYQPASVVVHYEGATAGTNIHSGMKSYQRTNAIKFKNKWKEQLQTKLPNSFMNLNDTLIKYDNSHE